MLLCLFEVIYEVTKSRYKLLRGQDEEFCKNVLDNLAETGKSSEMAKIVVEPQSQLSLAFVSTEN